MLTARATPTLLAPHLIETDGDSYHAHLQYDDGVFKITGPP